MRFVFVLSMKSFQSVRSYASNERNVATYDDQRVHYVHLAEKKVELSHSDLHELRVVLTLLCCF